MAEMMDRSSLDLDRHTQTPGVMEIIGGLGLLQSLEHTVEAAVAALDGPWGDLDAFAEDRGTSEGVWSKLETSFVGIAEADNDENPAGRETDVSGGRGDPLVARSEGESEAASPDENDAPLSQGLPDPQINPPAEVRKTSARESVEAAVESPAQPPPAIPTECLTESQTQPDLELCAKHASGNSGDLVTSEEQVEEVMMSEAKATPMPDGEKAHLNGKGGAMREELNEEAQSDGLEEVEEECKEGEEEEPVEEVMMSEAKATPMKDGEKAYLNGAGGASGEEPREEVHSDNLEEVEEECKGGEEEEKQQENSSQDSICSHGNSSQPSRKTATGRGRRKKSVSRTDLSKYNTVSYRTIRKGNTRQRIDEFESMIHT